VVALWTQCSITQRGYALPRRTSGNTFRSLDHDDDEESDRPVFELPALVRRRGGSTVVAVDAALEDADSDDESVSLAAAARTQEIAARNRRQQEIKTMLPEGVGLAKHSVSIRSAYGRSGPSAPARRAKGPLVEDVEDETDDEQNYTDDMLQLATELELQPIKDANDDIDPDPTDDDGYERFALASRARMGHQGPPVAAAAAANKKAELVRAPEIHRCPVITKGERCTHRRFLSRGKAYCHHILHGHYPGQALQAGQELLNAHLLAGGPPTWEGPPFSKR